MEVVEIKILFVELLIQQQELVILVGKVMYYLAKIVLYNNKILKHLHRQELQIHIASNSPIQYAHNVLMASITIAEK